MIICRCLVPPDDHLQVAGPSRRSFAGGRIPQMIFCNRLDCPDDHLQQQQRVTEVMGVTRGDGTGGGNCGNFNFTTMSTICFLEHFLATSDHHPDLIPFYHHVGVTFVFSLVRIGVQGPVHHNCVFYKGLSS